jgi:NB-ARC domain
MGRKGKKIYSENIPFLSYWNIPIIRNPFFTGRQDLLGLLHERFSAGRGTALTRAQALYGLGGIGKTQTAAEYVFRYGEEYTQVLWVQAASRETLVADVVRLAEWLELTDQQEPDQPRVIAAVKRWLAAHEGWLLVLDNADDLPLVQTFLPNSHKGFILFTTRAAAAGGIAAAVEVEKLSV